MNVLLIQLPIPRINFGLRTGNIPLGAACLKQAAAGIPDCRVDIFSPDLATYAADQAIITAVLESRPDMVGFTVFSWNVDRSLYLAGKIKEKIPAKVVFGGPQITSDTVAQLPDTVDFAVIGEGEAVFPELVRSQKPAVSTMCIDGAGSLEALNGGPYIHGHLKPGEDGVMLVETQRGCPYRCGFCFYGKSRKRIDVASDELVLENIAWGIENGAREIYLMDPSLNTRPGIEDLLDKIARINARHKVDLISEIRAESISPRMAERYGAAGFTEFEVGLQSINPQALALMNRRTDLNRFLDGVKALQKEGIKPVIDLIFGLPGDTVAGFRKTVKFITDNGLDNHVQVFPLLVLPGTLFRKKASALGLTFHPCPPYPVIRTNTLSESDLEACLDHAEYQFDRTFYPFPDLDVAYKSGNGAVRDHFIPLDGRPHLSKLFIDGPRSRQELCSLSRRICSPFQLFFNSGSDNTGRIRDVLRIFLTENPFVPVEIIWIDPDTLPDTEAILEGMPVPRPHFLDMDQRYLYPEPGSRSVLFTVISRQARLIFEGTMKRQVFLWDRKALPEKSDFLSLGHLDGLLVDTQASPDILCRWQDTNCQHHEDVLPLSFSDISHQVRWLSLTESKKYNMPLLSDSLRV